MTPLETPADHAVLPPEWEAMATRTGEPFAVGGAYASDMFADWRGCVVLLRERGATLEGAEALLRSKHMRWCSDGSREQYGHATVADLAAYLYKHADAREMAGIAAPAPAAVTLESAETMAERLWPEGTHSTSPRHLARHTIRERDRATAAALRSAVESGDMARVGEVLAALEGA